MRVHMRARAFLELRLCVFLPLRLTLPPAWLFPPPRASGTLSSVSTALPVHPELSDAGVVGPFPLPAERADLSETTCAEGSASLLMSRSLSGEDSPSSPTRHWFPLQPRAGQAWETWGLSCRRKDGR